MRKSTIKVGDQFSYLTINEVIRLGNRTYCICKCDCGNTVRRRQDYLFKCQSSTNKHIHSCGCHQYENNQGKNHALWKGHGDLSGEYLAQIRCKARAKNWDIDIDVEYLWNLFLEQDKKCSLTDIPIVLSQNGKKEQTASLDRIDSNKGYIKGNVHWVHKDVNKMKNNYPLERYIEICKLVAKNAKI